MIGVALGAWVLLVALGWTRGTLPLKPLLAAIGITLAVRGRHAVEPVGRRELLRDVRPHRHRAPRRIRSRRTRCTSRAIRCGATSATLWQRTPDIYGLGFTVIMAALAPVIGQSTFLVHFTYQLVALAAVGAMLWLLWKRTRNPAVLAFVGLHPLLAVSVVNGGHPDALVALGVLAGVLLAIERRPVLAGVAFAFAASVNFTALVGRGGAVRVGVPPLEPARGREVRGDRRRRSARCRTCSCRVGCRTRTSTRG